jgi:antitoxin ParD1/3/4
MTIVLPPQLEQLVVQKMQSGRYSTASEVIGEALHLLHERDQLHQQRRDELRRDLEAGIEQAPAMSIALCRPMIPPERAMRRVRHTPERPHFTW